MTRYQEIERKFDMTIGVPLPDLSEVAHAVSEPVGSRLDATYFDTADEDLARHRITLRRRTGGGDDGWHLKLPVGADERTEVRVPLGGANGGTTDEVPETLAREVRAIVHDRPLVPIATLLTTRVERRLTDADGKALAIVADDTVSGQRLGKGAVPVSAWREIEVELVDGDMPFLEQVSSALRAAGLTPSGSASKLARLLGESAAPTGR